MAYKNLGTFVTRVTLIALAKIEESSTDEAMRIAENVKAWASDGTITSAQLDSLMAALPEEVLPADAPVEEETQADIPEEEETQAEEIS